MRSIRKVVVVVSAVGLAASVLLAARWFASPGPTGPAGASVPEPPEQLSSEVPKEADFDDQGDEEKNRPFFNDFAWKVFIALNWPADDTLRGKAHATKKFGDTSGPIVWGSWKSVDELELFPPDSLNVPPTSWDSYDAVLTAPGMGKNGEDKLYDHLLPREEAGRVKFLANPYQGKFRYPEYALVAQNKTFVRYETRVNQVEYEYVLSKKLTEKFPGPDDEEEFQPDSITVRAAWRELPDDEQVRCRFYYVPAKVVDWTEDGAPVLRDCVVGLVGLHIAYKTPKHPNWIWMSFEHVDNTERSPSGISPPSFNSTDKALAFGAPSTNEPPIAEWCKPLCKAPTPVAVARLTPLDATGDVNTAYRNHPQIQKTVWANYQLVAVQWPTPVGWHDHADLQHRFPVDAVANVVMETYHQNESCIGCHNHATQFRSVFYPTLRTTKLGELRQAVNAAQDELKKKANLGESIERRESARAGPR